jgi:hypothetical protein
MAKVMLEFDTIEDEDAIKDCLNGFKWRMLVNELENYYRNMYKYSENEEEVELAEKVRAKIHELLNESELFL